MTKNTFHAENFHDAVVTLLSIAGFIAFVCICYSIKRIRDKKKFKDAANDENQGY
ncbi:MAG: hypothetical protein WDN09_00665 [bacterium]